MSRRALAGLTAGVVFCLLAIPLKGIYIGLETKRVPVARLVSNLEKQLASRPEDPELHLKLARLYGMAYTTNAESVPVAEIGGKEEVWFGHEPNLVPHGFRSGSEGRRTAAAQEYLRKALNHYRTAIELNPSSLHARLGYGWALEQSGDTKGAIAAYRAVIEQAWPKEQSAKFAELGQRFFTVEAGEYLIPLLDPQADAQEISELRSRMRRLESVPRPVTPLVIPLSDGATARSVVDLGAQVRFDADGSGRLRRWTWISADAGWLVYDAEGKGEIASALQLFGNVSFWLFWSDGYEALEALDDNTDGELSGAELRYLGIWQDRNGDGLSDRGEVRPVSAHGIVSLSCRGSAGDGIFATASAMSGVRFADGRVRPTFDVILRPAWSVSSPVP